MTVRWEAVLIGSVKWVLVPAVLAGVGFLWIGPNLDNLGSTISQVTPPMFKASTVSSDEVDDKEEPEVTIEATFRPTPVRAAPVRRSAPRPKPAETPPPSNDSEVNDSSTGDTQSDGGIDTGGGGGSDGGSDAGSGSGTGPGTGGPPPPDDGLNLGSRRIRDTLSLHSFLFKVV